MRTLVLSDIHANLAALTAVLQAAGTVDRILFLGDLANYGPYPKECIALLRAQKNVLCVQGNHDRILSTQEKAGSWDLAVRQTLSAQELAYLGSFHQHALLANGEILAVHSAPDEAAPLLYNSKDADFVRLFAPLREKYPTVRQILFGHYHYGFSRTVDAITYHCIRPVGHHRDHDKRASYSILTDGTLQHFHVEYELSHTAEGLRRLPYLDETAKQKMIALLENAFHEELLAEELALLKRNEKKS